MYLYIFESGEIGQSPMPPTNEDLMCIENGMLTVLKMKGGQFVHVPRDHVPVATSNVNAESGDNFHAVP